MNSAHLKSKNQLKKLSKNYKLKLTEFNSRQNQIVVQFNLKKSDRQQIFYGMIEPSDLSMKKYTDILNADTQLNKLNAEIKELYLTGNIMIIESINDIGITISGYDLDSFIKSPSDNFEEIDNLIKSLGGYKHIHIIGEKIALEIPARHYLKKHPKLTRLVDFWIKQLEIFAKE